MPADTPSDSPKPAPRCPICGGLGAAEFRPFCSRRCADVDLSRWLRGSYAIASTDDDDDEDGAAGAGGPEGVESDQGSAARGRRRH